MIRYTKQLPAARVAVVQAPVVCGDVVLGHARPSPSRVVRRTIPRIRVRTAGTSTGEEGQLRSPESRVQYSHSRRFPLSGIPLLFPRLHVIDL
ncbi:hypothetical protein BJX66DRAFT_89238 [Aspergillus keveii]|uniref:Uncharacterized protein n=1 Tax=Aspergillus keveii TaxID=714993 RepID=A0ABR4FM88_9EURO